MPEDIGERVSPHRHREDTQMQIDLFDEIIVDSFAGGGGASTGIEFATGQPVTIAINHDPAAILMHKTNHPYTMHYCESVWDVDPEKACAGRPVGLAWFSPDCTHHSKARGGKPVDKNIRGLAWIVLKWAAKVRPRIIILENVEEFQSWGPVRRGKAVKSKKGMTFQQWKGQLEGLGYAVEHRELVAADYGAPTIRKRFFLVARCDGKPIVWPEPTHSKDGSGGKPKWRSAAGIIDWSLPCPSIFDTAKEIKSKYDLRAQRPLRPNTMRRIARGIDKFVIRSSSPFIVPVGYGERAGQTPRVHDIDSPLPTVVGNCKHYLCQAALTMHNNENAAGTECSQPVNTVRTGGGGGQMLVTPALTAIGQTGGGDRARSVNEPVNTTVSKAETCLVTPALIQYHGEKTKEYVRGQGLDEPIMTIDGSNRYGLSAATITEYFGNADSGYPVTEPTRTATGKDRGGLTMAYMSKYYSGGYTGTGHEAAAPLATVTGIDHNALVAAHIVKAKGDNLGSRVSEPLQTVTSGGNHHGEVRTYLAKWHGAQDMMRWPQVRAMLNEHCGYDIPDDYVLVLEIDSTPWFISDIGLRMLTPRELYAANGFPPDYIIDRDYMGNEYKKDKQVARCGNAVPPPFATALVRANWPEKCAGVNISTMSALDAVVAV